MSYNGIVAASPAAFHPVGEDQLADDPFTSLNYHFGMLLGVDDFETEQAYHRGKHRLHQSWLHGPGVVWGLAVGLDLEHGEVRVEPGLALDGAGRELHLDVAACLDPAAWLEEHKSDVTLLDPSPKGAELAFDAHVVMRFSSCPTRSVPALAEPCEGARVESAYSRVWETVELELRPSLGAPPPDLYRRVRVLLGLLEPVAGDEDAVAARDGVLAADPAARPAVALAAFRAMANADAAALHPASGALTLEDPSAIVLGDIHGLALRRDGDRLVLAGGEVDYAPRRSHVQTATAQELVTTLLAQPAPALHQSPLGTGPQVTSVALGPRPGSRSRQQTHLVLSLSGPLDARSVQAEGFSVSALTAAGWTEVAFKDSPAQDAEPAPPTVTLSLAEALEPPWQVIARGTGTRPLIDAAAQPLGGGHDFVHLEGEPAPAPPAEPPPAPPAEPPPPPPTPVTN